MEKDVGLKELVSHKDNEKEAVSDGLSDVSKFLSHRRPYLHILGSQEQLLLHVISLCSVLFSTIQNVLPLVMKLFNL